MRKKDLIKLNNELFEKADSYIAQNEELKAEIKSLKEQLRASLSENNELKEQLDSSKPQQIIGTKDIVVDKNIPEDTAFGAEIIGKIVLKSAMHCNSLTTASDSKDNKELVNLILGRTEIAKAEILKIVSSPLLLDEKKEKIQKEYADAEDYFLSVIAQNG